MTFSEIAKLILHQEAQTQQTLILLMRTVTAPKTVTMPDGTVVSTDDGPRAGVTLEAVQGLKPVFREEGTVTAGNASQLSDGAAAVVLSATGDGPRITATNMVGGDGTGDYHSRVGDVAARLWTQLGVEARDADVVELHDANASELLWATDVIGITAPGEAAGALTAGRLEPDGDLPAVNPSGGLLGRGHPIGATGVYQLVELAEQVSGLAGSRQRLGADLGALFNCGGIIGEDTAAAVGIAVAGG